MNGVGSEVAELEWNKIRTPQVTYKVQVLYIGPDKTSVSSGTDSSARVCYDTMPY